ncbi:hypothetical protein ACLB2K_022421 [Fragaria x ananassa]
MQSGPLREEQIFKDAKEQAIEENIEALCAIECIDLPRCAHWVAAQQQQPVQEAAATSEQHEQQRREEQPLSPKGVSNEGNYESPSLTLQEEIRSGQRQKRRRMRKAEAMSQGSGGIGSKEVEAVGSGSLGEVVDF